jgi:hypothetical protein
MPIYNSQFFETAPGGGHVPSPTLLARQGPILQVTVSIPQALAAFYTLQQVPIPSPVTSVALIDTGASTSCVHAPIMQNMGVNPIGVVTILTPGGPTLRNLYPANFTFPVTGFSRDFTSIIGADLSGQIINGQQLIALIARDVLSLGVLIYNGSFGSFTFGV